MYCFPVISEKEFNICLIAMQFAGEGGDCNESHYKNKLHILHMGMVFIKITSVHSKLLSAYEYS